MSKIDTSPEAIDFVRRVTNESGGPNAKILKMRKDYVAVLKEKKARADALESAAVVADALAQTEANMSKAWRNGCASVAGAIRALKDATP